MKGTCPIEETVGKVDNSASNDDTDSENLVEVTFLTKEQCENQKDILFSETIGCAILDSGCSKSVCGDNWLETYLDTLSENEKKMVKYEPSDRKFKFGDNTVFTSLYKVLIPSVICSKRVMIGTDVIQTDIPLLLSKEAMRKANTVIHFQRNCVTMFGKPVSLLYTTVGHYCIALNKNVKLAYGENTTTKIYFVNIEKLK